MHDVILQMVIPKRKHDKPWKNKIGKVPALLLRTPAPTPYFHPFFYFWGNSRPEKVKIHSPAEFYFAVAEWWGEFRRRLFNGERLHGTDSLVVLHKEIKAWWKMKTESVKGVSRF